MVHTILVCALLCTVSMAQEKLRTPEEYPARARIGNFIIAAENLGPSIPNAKNGLFVDGYLVIEVAVFPQGAERRATLGQAHFGLRMNGARSVLRPDPPGFVSASIKYPDWERRGRLEASGGYGNADIILGRPVPVERFPGDRRPVEQRRPVPNPVPRVDSPTDRTRDDAPIEEQVQRAALAEGDLVLPVTGCLYFPYKGKVKKIKKLELVYEGPLGAGSVLIP